MVQKIERRSLLIAVTSSLTVSSAGCSAVSKPSSRAGPDPFYLENYTDEKRRFSLTISRERDGEAVVKEVFDVPSEHGAVLADVGELGEKYHFSISLDDISPLTGTWTVETCPSARRNSNANTAGGYFVREDATGFEQNQCGDQRVGDSDALTYIPATEVAVS